MSECDKVLSAEPKTEAVNVPEDLLVSPEVRVESPQQIILQSAQQSRRFFGLKALSLFCDSKQQQLPQQRAGHGEETRKSCCPLEAVLRNSSSRGLKKKKKKSRFKINRTTLHRLLIV